MFLKSKLSQSPISVKDFSNGIYFVELNNGKQKVVKKFVKE
ncbi:MAG: T9SS type A sorting domain-containing protein [Bacteroidetes bacterium]|nr:T9SS type A sorting domain-containing protein [Bacteroidota bacterium]